MSGYAVAQPQNVSAPQEKAVETVSFQRRQSNWAEPTVFHEGFFDEACRTFAEPRFGYDFSRIPAHTDMMRRVQPLLRTGTMVQRYSVNGNAESAPCSTCSDEGSTPISATAEPMAEPASPAPEATATTEPEEESAAPEETTASAFLVEDSAAELAPGQMRKSEFLAQLRAAVTSTAESAMAGTGRTTADCPYLDYWFGYYSAQDVQHVERALRRYAPEASIATTAREYIPIIAARVRRSVETWVRTGEITGVPEGLPGMGLLGTIGSLISGIGSIFFKARNGGARRPDDPRAIRSQLGRGQPLNNAVRSRMESAFGTDFSQVRTHTDTTAAGLSCRLNARAFTVGKHIAFGAGEYQPGTLMGDALIAHEMAHVVQQSGASDSVAPMQTGEAGYDMLESDADKSAMGAIASLWTGVKEGLSDIAQNAVPRLRSGLSISRCNRREGKSLRVCIKPVRFAEDDGSNPTTLPSFKEAADIWQQCCINITATAPETESNSFYRQPEMSPLLSPEALFISPLAIKYGGSGCIPVFIVKTFMVGGTPNKDYGGGAFSIQRPHPSVFAVEGIHPTIIGHELGHVMMESTEEGPSGTVMETGATHTQPVPEAVSCEICEKARKFSAAIVEEEECTISTEQR